jgi:hypothetical protein
MRLSAMSTSATLFRSPNAVYDEGGVVYLDEAWPAYLNAILVTVNFPSAASKGDGPPIGLF